MMRVRGGGGGVCLAFVFALLFLCGVGVASAKPSYQETFQHDGKEWQRHVDHGSGKPYFYNMETHKSSWTDPRGPGHDSKESAGGAAAGGDAGGAAAGGGAGGGAKKTGEKDVSAHDDGALKSKGTAREEEANAAKADSKAGHAGPATGAGAAAGAHEDKTHVASQQQQQQQQPELVSKRKHPINKRYHDGAVGGMMGDPDNIPEAPHRHAPFVKGTVMVMGLASFVSALIWLHYIVRRISDRGGPGGTGSASGGGGGVSSGGGGGGGGRSGGLMRDMTREVGREAAEGAKKTLDKAKETMKSRAGQLGALVSDVKSSKTGGDAAAKLTAAIKNADQAAGASIHTTIKP